jgi:hypothetical protein
VSQTAEKGPYGRMSEAAQMELKRGVEEEQRRVSRAQHATEYYACKCPDKLSEVNCWVQWLIVGALVALVVLPMYALGSFDTPDDVLVGRPPPPMVVTAHTLIASIHDLIPIDTLELTDHAGVVYVLKCTGDEIPAVGELCVSSIGEVLCLSDTGTPWVIKALVTGHVIAVEWIYPGNATTTSVRGTFT